MFQGVRSACRFEMVQDHLWLAFGADFLVESGVVRSVVAVVGGVVVCFCFAAAAVRSCRRGKEAV